jgi:hypothetical protein
MKAFKNDDIPESNPTLVMPSILAAIRDRSPHDFVIDF